MAQNYEDKPDTGRLFLNPEKRANEKAPDMTGRIVLQDGTVRRLAAWRNASQKTGNVYFNISVSDLNQDGTAGTQAPVQDQNQAGQVMEMEDDLPF